MTTSFNHYDIMISYSTKRKEVSDDIINNFIKTHDKIFLKNY